MSTQEFEIGKLIELARHKKYELTSAGFAALDKIERIAVPKKLKTRKIAVQALYALSDGMVKYDYFSPEERKKLQAEANMSDAPYKGGFKGLFSNSAAPVVEEDTEEDFIPQEEEAKHDFVADGDEMESADSDEEEDDDDDEDEDEEDDDDLDDEDDEDEEK